MLRRDLLKVVAGLMTCSPLAALAQQPGHARRIGLLMIVPEEDPQSRLDRNALESGLRELGWVSGRNVDLAGAMVTRLFYVNTPRSWLAYRPTCL